MERIWDAISGWASNHLSDWTTSKMYLGCAIAGGTIILSQLGLNLFGLGGHEDIDMDPDADVDSADGGDNLHFLSIRTLAAFLTFFGLVGAAGVSKGWPSPVHSGVALAAGIAVMFMVAAIMRWFTHMQSEGTIDPTRAVGMTAQVYLRIPPEHSGMGKIQVSMQGRTVEFQAVTAGDELPTGAACVIQKQVTSDTFEVVPSD